MTFQELLTACGKGRMPKVESMIHIKYSHSRIGRVTTIKQNGKHMGVGVIFDGMDYETWFHESMDTDRRSRYMRDLIIIPDETA